MGYACSGCGSGAQQTLIGRRGIPLGVPAVMEPLNTLLGFETTGPSPLRPDGGKPEVVVTRVWVGSLRGSVVVVAPSLVVGCGV